MVSLPFALDQDTVDHSEAHWIVKLARTTSCQAYNIEDLNDQTALMVTSILIMDINGGQSQYSSEDEDTACSSLPAGSSISTHSCM